MGFLIVFEKENLIIARVNLLADAYKYPEWNARDITGSLYWDWLMRRPFALKEQKEPMLEAPEGLSSTKPFVLKLSI